MRGGAGLAVPFVCTGPDGRGEVADLQRERVVQCALSRVCAVCAMSLDRPLHLVGSAAEADDNAFRLPPVHASCVADVLRLLAADDHAPAFGHPDAGPWTVVVTGGFDLVRPTTRTGLHQFRPNAVVARHDDASTTAGGDWVRRGSAARR